MGECAFFFLIIASVAMLVGSILAIAQTNIKKMLAYSVLAKSDILYWEFLDEPYWFTGRIAAHI